MNDVVCPNCQSVTPPFQHCLACNAFLGDRLDCTFGKTPREVAKPVRKLKSNNESPLSHLLALARSVVRHYTTSLWCGTKSSVRMDARLRRDCRRTKEHGVCKLPTSSTGADEVAVIARVNNLAKFRERVKNVTTVIEGIGEDKTVIVTARMRGNEAEIERLRNEGFVKSLKAATRIRPFADRNGRETLASGDSLPGGHEPKGGGKVIIGFVDFGLDFAHRNLRDSHDNTRILALWDQKAPYDEKHGPELYKYGRVYRADEINRALKNEADPYKELGYFVPKDDLFDASSHGTYVADVAAGNGRGSGNAGVAPEARIVFVDVATAGTLAQGDQAIGSTFGDSVQLLEAIHFIFDLAKTEGCPCVVNISLGTNGGPHDGSSPLEEAIDRMVRQEPNRAVVIAAGNSFGKSLHAMGRVPEGGCCDLKWRIPRFDATSNEMEIWYAGEDRFTLDLFDPNGWRVARVKPGETWENNRRGEGRMTVVNRLDDPNNKDNTINVYFERGVRAGIWTLRLRGDSARNGDFHAWIERDEEGQSRFVKSEDESYQISDEYTLSSIACGRETIVVTSFDAHKPDLPLSETSSSGPTRDKRDKPGEYQQPTVSAPGEDVFVAQPGTQVLRHRQSGTSLAAAVVTGTVALMLDASHERRDLKSNEIRQILIGTALRNPPDGKDWHSGYGYGRVCTEAAVAEARRRIGKPALPNLNGESREAVVSENVLKYAKG